MLMHELFPFIYAHDIFKENCLKCTHRSSSYHKMTLKPLNFIAHVFEFLIFIFYSGLLLLSHNRHISWKLKIMWSCPLTLAWCYIWCVGNSSVSRSISSEEPLNGPSNNTHLTFLPPAPSSHPDRDVGNLFLKHHKVQKQDLDKETSKSRSDDANNKTRINTKRPTAKPARPAKPTDPPFIGDSYMSEDVPPQTVSSP